MSVVEILSRKLNVAQQDSFRVFSIFKFITGPRKEGGVSKGRRGERGKEVRYLSDSCLQRVILST